ncbi:hypothetical protein LTR37_018024 [Vermiconidia calcicola]|uniref:Uncharacterized protein n=1 Tax=Vermiconidia calcicola TaxID=1690605 RepID=A0ACC3MI93_9PEZI|nr:hypothetical protein LTR37_018024 [Vermiconidia calcicola]
MDGKVIAVTGAASGIGFALAKLLATRGAKVSMSADVFTATCDVRNVSQIRDWLKQTVVTFGRLDGAANIAGVISKYMQ